ncbi:hypothetical protein [Streptomyces sp. NPDC046909]|uniref:hypothetical protein n=1 Tax=Streptomyces sp. NPDC046909 TaxID=3155617 RepID=UPI003406737F
MPPRPQQHHQPLFRDGGIRIQMFDVRETKCLGTRRRGDGQDLRRQGCGFGVALDGHVGEAQSAQFPHRDLQRLLWTQRVAWVEVCRYARPISLTRGRVDHVLGWSVPYSGLDDLIEPTEDLVIFGVTGKAPGLLVEEPVEIDAPLHIQFRVVHIREPADLLLPGDPHRVVSDPELQEVPLVLSKGERLDTIRCLRRTDPISGHDEPDVE